MLTPLSLLTFLLVFLAAFTPSYQAPYALRISCGARKDVHTPPTNTFWYRDFGYSGGIPSANATRPSYITPPLSTLRYFPLSTGPENCYHIERVPHGHYSVRVFLGLIHDPTFDNEPLFDVSVEGTVVYSLSSGWSNHDDEQAFVEALVFLEDGTASICFHSTGHGDPAVLSIEVLQVGNNAYNYGSGWGRGTILRTHKRLSCGAKSPKFDVDYSGNHWGGDRFWNSITTFGQKSDRALATKNSIKLSSNVPNYYPEALYQTALVSTDNQPDLTYTMDVDPNRNYSIWLHFAEIDPSVTGEGQRVFDILINVAVSGRSLTISMHPVKGSHAIISAIEIFEIVRAESKTLIDEVRALQKLKNALGLPLRFGWNGDPCVPQQHPWSGVDCQFDSAKSKWVIDGLGLDNQGLRGFLPADISKLSHLQNMNLSENSIKGHIPSSLGTIASLEVLDLSYNFFNGSIPESLGGLTSVRILNLNSNSLTGRVPAALGGRLLHRASFNFTDNKGLCGIPGLPTCGPHLTAGAKIGIALGSCAVLLLIATCLTCWWKRRQNILRAQKIAARGAPYAKARTHFARDVQLTRHNSGQEHARTAAENGPILLS
ncbi:receptor-like protein 4 isoform X2 [Cynara cardunculus var. scolymus]|uniref:receptor-like protein 4 isoform X2 n=1 Tax=Cynara cardunculus var. scolymus TaxID=59895 RepID=UPI000D624C42|nr:receptor-like protein 4 isoform X2 [Cynara cardunculus var. scolymus]